ncbi:MULTISPECIES: protein-L-isoaspartate(D-aspartate) O-methyltransferase [Rhodopseudomonas]|uniref:protein-L-isoaspartate(D-aspartate) O-methyltransferase n=1 Tax=Rhodopseudomonas TaxID=1073 RepID=UPI00064269C7|nr:MULTISPECIES: protein-L-isoaspartate(D-aspartate) O-methyltransferase [Rhodopseudomonas]NEW89257.1 protein-L-isoaspartate(D-aspartate) O-methyltransferase [Rhodopseudomonas sp. WA056]
MTSPASGIPPPLNGRSFAVLRELMVERQIVARGVHDPRVLAAMRKVPREAFLPEPMRDLAYEDAPVPIAGEQTMSQPYIVALMMEALLLQGGDNVLEIGTGSGYAAAVLGEIAGHVATVERIATLADTAAAKLAELGYVDVHVHQGDGTRGWPPDAPYDAIVVAAGGPQVPDSLKAQLKIGGRLVMPVGADQHAQQLVRLTRLGEADFKQDRLGDVRFVPLLGAEGWQRVEPADKTARDNG